MCPPGDWQVLMPLTMHPTGLASPVDERAAPLPSGPLSVSNPIQTRAENGANLHSRGVVRTPNVKD
jgi:hypothetical protein